MTSVDRFARMTSVGPDIDVEERIVPTLDDEGDHDRMAHIDCCSSS